MRTDPKKTYEHDCTECKFLGRVVSRYRWTDLYAHENPSGSVSLIARYSSMGSDYASTNFDYAERTSNSDLYTAYTLYKESKK